MIFLHFLNEIFYIAGIVLCGCILTNTLREIFVEKKALRCVFAGHKFLGEPKVTEIDCGDVFFIRHRTVCKYCDSSLIEFNFRKKDV